MFSPPPFIGEPTAWCYTTSATERWDLCAIGIAQSASECAKKSPTSNGVNLVISIQSVDEDAAKMTSSEHAAAVSALETRARAAVVAFETMLPNALPGAYVAEGVSVKEVDGEVVGKEETVAVQGTTNGAGGRGRSGASTVVLLAAFVVGAVLLRV